MIGKVLPIPVGQTDTGTWLASSLGRLYEDGAKTYRLVKAAAEITTPTKKVLVSAVASGAKSWSVNTTTTANNWLAAGVVPSSLTATIASGAYFLIQVSGAATCISAAAVADGGLVGTSTAAGKVDDATVAAGVGCIGNALESAAGADEDLEVELRGLV